MASAFVVWLFFGWLAVALVRLCALKISCLAVPNHRSSHTLVTPQGGGLGMVVVSLALVVWLWHFDQLDAQLVLLVVMSVPVAVTGLLDDLYHLSPLTRLGVHSGAIVSALWVVGPSSLGMALPLWGAIFLCLLAGVWWINLFNFMDGIDAIAGLQGIFLLLSAGALSCVVQGVQYEIDFLRFLIVLSAIIGGFLVHNWPPARIFMGDAGSTWLAFLLFSVALVTVQRGLVTLVAWIILPAVFIADTSVTLLTRMALAERWYEAHRRHAYQRLTRRWYGANNAGHRAVSLLVSLSIYFGCSHWLGPA